jgi:type I restriction enzyme, S subunit
VKVKEARFGDLFEFIRNGMSVRQDKSGNGLPITRIETISVGVVDPTRVGFAELREEDCRDWLLQPGDILFSHINSVEHVGKCAIYEGAPEKLVHGMNLLCLRCDQRQILPIFAKLLIRSPGFRRKISNFINKAVNQASISITNLKDVLVEIPPLSEQQLTAAMLDQAETLRAKRRYALTKLDTLTQSLFLDLFGDPRTNPKNWPATTLGDLLVCIRNGVNAEQRTEPGGWPISRIETIWDGTIDETRVRWIEPDERLLDQYRLKPGDILFSHINSPAHIAKTALYCGKPEILIHGINLLRLRADDARVHPVWFLHLLKHPATRAHFQTRCKKAVNQASLNQTDIKPFATILPPLKLQKEFASAVSAIERIKSTQVLSLAKLDTLFVSLQQRAFRGEL